MANRRARFFAVWLPGGAGVARIASDDAPASLIDGARVDAYDDAPESMKAAFGLLWWAALVGLLWWNLPFC